MSGSKTYLFSIFLIVLFAIGICHGQTGSASAPSPQACTIAYYSKDSVAIKMSGFKPWFDSIQRIQIRKQALQQKTFLATDRMLMAEPDSGISPSPKQQSEYNSAKKETESLKNQTMKLDEQVAQLSTLYLKPYYDSIARVAQKVAQEQHMSAVFETGENSPMACPTNQLLMIDITNDIARSVGVKPVLLRVGVYNSDSLLRLLPGYSVLADSAVVERKKLKQELELMDVEIAQLEHELDSLRPSLSKRAIKSKEEEIAEKKDLREIHFAYENYKIDERDSVRTVVYRRKLRKAITSTAKQSHCTKYYDAEFAYTYWSAKEAEFIDLNADIAGQLR